MIDLAEERREELVAELGERLDSEEIPNSVSERFVIRQLLEDPQIRRLWRLRGDLFALETERAQECGADTVQETAFEMGATVNDFLNQRISEVLEEIGGGGEENSQTSFWDGVFDEQTVA
jgi:hypothetical protein